MSKAIDEALYSTLIADTSDGSAHDLVSGRISASYGDAGDDLPLITFEQVGSVTMQPFGGASLHHDETYDISIVGRWEDGLAEIGDIADAVIELFGNRTVHDVTKYGDTGRRRVLGLLDVTGSAGGFASHSASHLALDAGAGMQAAGQAFDDLVLTFFTGCTWTFHAVIDSMAATSTMGGDTTVTMNFQLADGAGLTEAWDES
jgi:hypothetical protein